MALQNWCSNTLTLNLHLPAILLVLKAKLPFNSTLKHSGIIHYTKVWEALAAHVKWKKKTIISDTRTNCMSEKYYRYAHTIPSPACFAELRKSMNTPQLIPFLHSIYECHNVKSNVSLIIYYIRSINWTSSSLYFQILCL